MRFHPGFVFSREELENTELKELNSIFKFNPALEGGLSILGGYMNAEVVEQKKQAVDAAVAEYGQAQKDFGVASVKGGDSTTAPKVVMTPEEFEAKIAEAKAVGADEYKANDPTKWNDEDVAKAVTEAVTASETKSSAVIADLNLQLSQKDTEALEEAIADQVEAAVAVVVKNLRERSPSPAPVEA